MSFGSSSLAISPTKAAGSSVSAGASALNIRILLKC
jgi:hypothetical protein